VLVHATDQVDAGAGYHSVAEIIAYCSRAFTLRPGDVIATGTPGGVGIFRDPPLLLQDGDEVVVEISGVGRLVNHCRTTKNG
jgi:2-keto-4-pentenoate hydratase/2-oxohepta-3-ene-1,7-dioic acid hydratase in catechol pathway